MHNKYTCACGREYNLSLTLSANSTQAERVVRKHERARKASNRASDKSSLSDEAVNEIRVAHWVAGVSQPALARSYNVVLSTIQRIVTGQRRRFAPGPTSAPAAAHGPSPMIALLTAATQSLPVPVAAVNDAQRAAAEAEAQLPWNAPAAPPRAPLKLSSGPPPRHTVKRFADQMELPD